MTITTLSRTTGVPSSALRYYESIGLLGSTRRTPAGYRLYAADAVDRVRFIRLAQEGGLTLDDIRAVLEPRGSSTTCAAVRQILRRRLAEVRAKLAEMRRLETVLERGLACRAGSSDGLCATICAAAGAACAADASCCPT